MENLCDKVNLDNHYTNLDKIENIDNAIENQIGCVYDELKSYIECLTCCKNIHHNVIDLEARFDYALANLKFLAWEKFRKEKTKGNPFV